MLRVQVPGGMDVPHPPTTTTTTGELRTSPKVPESWACTRLIQLEKTSRFSLSSGVCV